ncbi:VOC family protein [Streptococcus loxodontisalivarius]|uniref:Catechol 2,3-dioxygenase-like lactoylglutathione lyase family enzyme n=1 Tax=Streptococcus loxodontisalivarius TaxID=1349415 RepID=A0ABS2PQ87_9STRE|nr:VOC family protein [Streptococcus loxodontisalivarius]MBM7642207.1 catechol 2,3-dioxygenase-like lactoylglutathione lyase family enzyme [Streptococcus loxodontisalivarius]
MNRINLICLGVRDMARSVAFYRDGLGFETKETADCPEVIFFNNAGTKLELYPLENLSADFGAGLPTLPAGHFNGMTMAYNVKERSEVDSVLALAKSAGASILKEPQEVFWGGYHAYFADPDNYVWEVCWNPTMPFDDNDMAIV